MVLKVNICMMQSVNFFDGKLWEPKKLNFKNGVKYNYRLYVGSIHTKFPTSYIGLGSLLDLDTTDGSQCWVIYNSSNNKVTHAICGIKKDGANSHLITLNIP